MSFASLSHTLAFAFIIWQYNDGSSIGSLPSLGARLLLRDCRCSTGITAWPGPSLLDALALTLHIPITAAHTWVGLW
jgi:hypothetical protein